MADFDRHAEARPDVRGVMGTASTILTEILNLLRGEFALARAEIGEKVSGLVGAAMVLVAGAVLIIAALVVLLNALVIALVASGIHPGWAALIVGGGAMIVGGMAIMTAKARFKPQNLAPEKTVAQFRKDSETLREASK